MKRPREKGRKCGRKGKKGERKRKKGGKKIRKEEAKGKNKCKIGKNQGKKVTMGVEKRHVARGEKNIIFRRGGGNKYRFRTEI